MTTVRIILFLIGSLSAAFFSPFIAALSIVLLSVRYRAWEAIIIGGLIDMLWLPHHAIAYSLPVCTLIAALLVWGFEPLRREFLL